MGNYIPRTPFYEKGNSSFRIFLRNRNRKHIDRKVRRRRQQEHSTIQDTNSIPQSNDTSNNKDSQKHSNAIRVQKKNNTTLERCSIEIRFYEGSTTSNPSFLVHLENHDGPCWAHAMDPSVNSMQQGSGNRDISPIQSWTIDEKMESPIQHIVNIRNDTMTIFHFHRRNSQTLIVQSVFHHPSILDLSEFEILCTFYPVSSAVSTSFHRQTSDIKILSDVIAIDTRRSSAVVFCSAPVSAKSLEDDDTSNNRLKWWNRRTNSYRKYRQSIGRDALLGEVESPSSNLDDELNRVNRIRDDQEGAKCQLKEESRNEIAKPHQKMEKNLEYSSNDDEDYHSTNGNPRVYCYFPKEVTVSDIGGGTRRDKERIVRKLNNRKKKRSAIPRLMIHRHSVPSETITESIIHSSNIVVLSLLFLIVVILLITSMIVIAYVMFSGDEKKNKSLYILVHDNGEGNDTFVNNPVTCSNHCKATILPVVRKFNSVAISVSPPDTNAAKVASSTSLPVSNSLP